MTANSYQSEAMRTASCGIPGDRTLMEGVLGLNGEAGECADIVKKHLYQQHPLDKDHLIEELGDVAWYLALCATALDVELDYILDKNIEKLKGRYPDGFDSEKSIHREV